MAAAGFAREKSLATKPGQGRFKIGLLLSLTAGVLQAGLSFAFVYSQGPLIEALQTRNASSTGAIAAVWAVALFGGALANIIFPFAMQWRKRNFSLLMTVPDFVLSLLMALLFVALLLCMGNGMRMLGALGASAGFGIYQGLQILSAQGVGIVSGEWRGTEKKTQYQMLTAVFLVLLGVSGMALAH